MKAKLFGAVVLLALHSSQAKAITYTVSATLMGGSGNPQLLQWTNRPLEIENGQIVAFEMGTSFRDIAPMSQGPTATNAWHLNYSDTIHQSPVNAATILCPLGCFVDLVFPTLDSTLNGYLGGPILSLAFFTSSQFCPGGVCNPVLSARFDMIAGTGTITQTPIPGALPLFATGLGLLGWLGWRRKRRIPVLTNEGTTIQLKTE